MAAKKKGDTTAIKNGKARDKELIAQDIVDTQIWQMREAHLSLRQIARQLDLAPETVRQRWNGMLRRAVPPEDASVVAAEQVLLLDRLTAECFAIATGTREVQEINDFGERQWLDDEETQPKMTTAYIYETDARLRATREARMNTKRKAEILGTDAPRRIVVEGAAQNPIASRIEQIMANADMLRRAAHAELEEVTS